MPASVLIAPAAGPRLESIVVEGGRTLGGEIAIGGYKHALTVLVAATVALGRSVRLRNVPRTTETLVLERILSAMGAASRFAGDVWELDTRPMRSMPVPSDLSELIHGSLYLAPALLARFGQTAFRRAGGDRIGPRELGGDRPAAQVAAVMERFGAVVAGAEGIRATARRLRGCAIDLMDFSSHPIRLRGPAASSATKTALLLAAVAEGETTLRHPVDRDATRELCEFLRAAGVTVTQEEDLWRVSGRAHDRPVDHCLISDGAEIVTFIACAAHAGASLRLTGITGERARRAIQDELRVLESSGVPLHVGRDWIDVHPPVSLRPVDTLEIECNGFSTDAHPFLSLVLLGAGGESRVTDHVWTSRFAYVRLLRRMGARMEVSGNTVRVLPSRLRPSPSVLEPTDSRAAAVAVLAALGTTGSSRIVDSGHLARSYQGFVDKLCGVGGQVVVSDSSGR